MSGLTGLKREQRDISLMHIAMASALVIQCRSRKRDVNVGIAHKINLSGIRPLKPESKKDSRTLVL